MKKALAAGLLFIGLSVPAIAEDKIWIGKQDRSAFTVLEVKSRTKDIVVITNSVYLDYGKTTLTSHDVILDCPNKTMISDYPEIRQKKWESDGNLWFTENTGKRFYSSDVGKWYTFGCLGELPPDGHYY